MDNTILFLFLVRKIYKFWWLKKWKIKRLWGVIEEFIMLQEVCVLQQLEVSWVPPSDSKRWCPKGTVEKNFCIRPRAKWFSCKSHSVKAFLGVQGEHGSLSALVPHALCNVAIMPLIHWPTSIKCKLIFSLWWHIETPLAYDKKQFTSKVFLRELQRCYFRKGWWQELSSDALHGKHNI